MACYFDKEYECVSMVVLSNINHLFSDFLSFQSEPDSVLDCGNAVALPYRYGLSTQGFLVYK